MIDFGYGAKLGPLELEHMETARRWRNDYSIWKWCRQNDLISAESQKTWFLKQGSDPTIKMYAVYSHDIFVGVCGLTSICTLNRRAEFSLYIEPSKQGLGRGKAALLTLLAHGFRNQGLYSIWGESFAGNPATEMFKKIGFSYDGKNRSSYFRDGGFVDSEIYCILATEFLTNPARP